MKRKEKKRRRRRKIRWCKQRGKGATQKVGRVADIGDAADGVFVRLVFTVDNIPSGSGLM